MSIKEKTKPQKQKLTRKQKKEINKLVFSYKGDGKAHSAQDSIPYERAEEKLEKAEKPSWQNSKLQEKQGLKDSLNTKKSFVIRK